MVLNKIYEDQIPEVRRVPAILVMKIKKEILSLLECIEADGAHVFRLEDCPHQIDSLNVRWSHSQLRAATLTRYFSVPDTVRGSPSPYTKDHCLLT